MDNLNVSGVYKILCLVNGKFYIGSSINIMNRWKQHWSEKERAKTKNQMMYDDMRKYGKENFRIYVIYEGEDYKHIEKVVTCNLQPEYNIRHKTRKVPHYKRWASKTEYRRHYYQTERGKAAIRKSVGKYCSRPCLYNGRKIRFQTLYLKFRSMGIENASKEASKYLITTQM